MKRKSRVRAGGRRLLAVFGGDDGKRNEREKSIERASSGGGEVDGRSGVVRVRGKGEGEDGVTGSVGVFRRGRWLVTMVESEVGEEEEERGKRKGGTAVNVLRWTVVASGGEREMNGEFQAAAR
ncbi:hypothetical protein HAX54_001688, partial [Datura stramonium]|nr:hypothetical protein [Datura stramonium]